MQGELSVLSPAKFNLTLSVLGKRPDGFHNLDSIVQTISLYDRITMKRTYTGRVDLICDNPQVPLGSDNVIYRACELMSPLWGNSGCGLSISMEKHIPMQAGLGGGSSNAAVTIMALNSLFGLNLPRDEMTQIGAKLGSDVVLFLHGGTVRMTGRGEVITPLPDGLHFHYVLIKPEKGISTAWAYNQLDGRAEFADNAIGEQEQDAWCRQDLPRFMQAMHNDFHKVAQQLLPEIEQIEHKLSSLGADRVLLAGSGSAVAGVFTDKKTCEQCHSALRSVYNNIWICETLGRNATSLESLIWKRQRLAP